MEKAKYGENMPLRIDGNLEANFDAFCANVGMTANGAVTLLMRKTVEKKEIPFKVTANVQVKSAYEGGNPQTLRRSIRVDTGLKKKFKETCKDVGISMSRLIKMFMCYCINTGNLPF